MRGALLALGLVLCGCITPAPVPDDDDDVDEVEALRQPLSCVGEVGEPTAVDGGYRVQTEHYDLSLRGVDADEARSLARMAEAAWEGWQAWFPTAFDGSALPVWLEPTQQEFLDRVASDGLPPPSDAGGYFHPTSGAAYLSKQPSVWYTRVLFLHELTHQAHWLSRGAVDLPSWYIEGAAEYLSRHDWDRECLRLGVTPQLSLEDPAEDALPVVADAQLEEWLDGSGVPGRPAALSLFRFLGTSPSWADGWEEARAAAEDGEEPDTAWLEAHVGDVDAVQADWQAWLLDDQEPLDIVYVSWLHRGPREVRGWSDGGMTLARRKEPGAFSMVTEEPLGDLGVLVEWDSTDDYATVLVNGAGDVSVFAVRGGAVQWSDLDSVKVDGAVRWELEHEGAEAVVRIDGAEVRVPVVGTPAQGLAVLSDDVIFSDLSWETK